MTQKNPPRRSTPHKREGDGAPQKRFSPRREREPHDENERGRRPYRPIRREDEGSRRPYRSVRREDEGGRRPYRPAQSEDERGRRPYRPAQSEDERGRRPYRPAQTEGERGRRPYRPAQSEDERGRRPYRPAQSEDERGRRPYRPTRREDEGSRRPYRSVRREDEGGRRPYRPSRREDEEGRRPYRPRFAEPYEDRNVKLRPRRSKEREERAPVTRERSRPTFDPAKNEMRLNKFLSNSGICSRREADQYITAGLVTVNGEVITTLGVRVKITDDVRYNGERLLGEELVYILMNKPKDFVTTTHDPHAEKTVLDLLEGKCTQRVYPVGRLDKSTTGVLLLTNDGTLTEQLTHPSYNRKKIYQVDLETNLKKSDMEALVKGVELEDGLAQVDEISYVDNNEKKIGLEIHSGRNRVVRRMFEHLGYTVKKLDRVYFAGLTKKRLRRGAWQFLSPKEVAILKMGSYE